MPAYLSSYRFHFNSFSYLEFPKFKKGKVGLMTVHSLIIGSKNTIPRFSHFLRLIPHGDLCRPNWHLLKLLGGGGVKYLHSNFLF